jgi:hypothetical protein
MRSGEQSSALPEVEERAVPASAQAATAAVELVRQRVAVLVETVDGARLEFTIAAAGGSGVEEVYGVPYFDVGCDVCCDVCWIHHFSPLITAIRRRQ